MRAQRAHILFRLNRRREALPRSSAAIDSLERLPATDTARRLAAPRVLLGRLLNETGSPRDAEPTLAAALRGLEHLGPANPQRAEAACELARARLLQQPRDEERRRLRASACRPIEPGDWPSPRSSPAWNGCSTTARPSRIVRFSLAPLRN